MGKFPHFQQADAMDCGPTCLRIISKFFGRNIKIETLRKLCETTVEGTSLFALSEGAEKIGFRTFGANITFAELSKEAPLPIIAHWKQNHFVVVYKITSSKVFISDPAVGRIEYSKSEFISNWTGSQSPDHHGVVLLLEPTSPFYKQNDDPQNELVGLKILWPYIERHRGLFIQLIISLLASSLIQLIFPFLTQSIVDVGIANRDIHFIYIILLAQIFLFLGKIGIEFVKSWIPLHINTRINISLVSEFLIKLMRLPVSYFNSKMTGDIIQRINDHKKIESLLSASTLNALFSAMNLVVFGAALAWYSGLIFAVFLCGTAIYLGWVLLFLHKRRILNYKQFAELSINQNKVMELISGMQEIKLHHAETQKRWDWERIQVRLFKISSEMLAVDQTQAIGSSLINEGKNIIITILAAKLVIDGQITLGMMLSISYMIGQLNSPVQLIVGFIHSWQDAKIGMERIREIHSMPDEEPYSEFKRNNIPANTAIVIEDLSFRYQGSTSNVLTRINFTICPNKVTAIVGASGSGKTTLMKLLLKFHEPNSGKVSIGNASLSNIAQTEWRHFCGAVMQEGYIFNDTIANNVAIGSGDLDAQKIGQSLEIANIAEFVNALPMNIHTKIGTDGLGLSTGQKQRMLIARAVYKNPRFIIFDEATSALDATSEKVVMDNLMSFLKDRTAVIIAHRLSTVQNADNIIVLGDGQVLESGTHESLLSNRGPYFKLVKNQLQLELIANETAVSAI